MPGNQFDNWGSHEKAGRAKEWFDYDGFWRETFSQIFTEKSVALASEVVDKPRAKSVDVKLSGNLDGDPYGPDATRLIAVGGKAKKGWTTALIN